MLDLLHRYTLLFDPELETEYRRYRMERDKPTVVRVVSVITACVAVTLPVLWLAFDIRTVPLPSLVAQLCLLGILVALTVMTRQEKFEPVFDALGIIGYGATAVCFGVVMASTLPDRVLLAGYLFIGGVVVLGAMPHVLGVHAVASATFLVSFLVSAFVGGAFARPGFIGVTVLFFFSLTIVTISWATLEHNKRIAYMIEREIVREREWSATLLGTILPPRLTAAMKGHVGGREAIVESHADVAVVFVDIVGFTPLAAGLKPAELVRLLNDIFCRFDAVVERAGAEKIKTIGDAYMAVAGLQPSGDDPVVVAADAALEMRECVRRYAILSGLPLQVRIGMHCGPVVAGVIGTSRMHFDLWGETVNVAARMEAHGVSGAVQVTEAVARRLAGRYELTMRRRVQLKGVGEVDAYVLVAPVFERARVPVEDESGAGGQAA